MEAAGIEPDLALNSGDSATDEISDSCTAHDVEAQEDKQDASVKSRTENAESSISLSVPADNRKAENLHTATADNSIQEIINLWPSLSPDIKTAVLNLIREHGKTLEDKG